MEKFSFYPTAMEKALKLEDIIYIHSEANVIGKLKHSPVALIDSDILVIYTTQVVFTIPLQLLPYYVTLPRGYDVD